MDPSKKIALVALLIHRRKKKKNTRERKYWVHPSIKSRNETGAFFVLFPELKNDEVKFFDYFQMSSPTFEELLQLLYPHIKRNDTYMRNSIEPAEMLAITLRYLASGCSFTELHNSYRLGVSTATKIVRDVCTAIWSNLSAICIPKITQEYCEATAASFQERENFPHCIGAVGGKHIRTIKRQLSESLYYKCKGYFSIVLMAVADTNYKFTCVDIGAFGGACDSTIFKQCTLWKNIVGQLFELPEEKPLPGAEKPNMPYFFVGDESFCLHRNLMRPFGGRELTEKKATFNYRLNSLKRYVETAFEILGNKWRILHRPMNVDLDFAIGIVKACMILHNLVGGKDGFRPEDAWPMESDSEAIGLDDLPVVSTTARGGATANHIRSVLADYFLTEAESVTWHNPYS